MKRDVKIRKMRHMMVAFTVFNLMINQITMGAENMSGDLITSNDIQGLPDPVTRFLEYSGVVGTPRITSAKVEQEGLFKMAPDKPWVPFTATQIYNIPEASFEWKVRMKMAPLITVKGSDALKDGLGSMKIKLFGFIPLVNAQGPEMDQGAMTRYLSEAIWFPQVFIDDHISWEALDSLSAKAVFTIGAKSVSGIFYFNEMGQITRFECQRYATEGKEMVLRPWVTPVDEYGEMGGLQLGVRGRATWKLPAGDYTYVDVKIVRVIYE